MSCIDISLINSYFDNELDEKNSHQVEEHVKKLKKIERRIEKEKE